MHCLSKYTLCVRKTELITNLFGGKRKMRSGSDLSKPKFLQLSGRIMPLFVREQYELSENKNEHLSNQLNFFNSLV